MPFDLLVFTKKYNDRVIENYSKNKYYKEGMDILYKGIYTIIYHIIDKNNFKIENAKILNVFADKSDYNLGLKRVKAMYKYKIYEINQKEYKPMDIPIKKEKEFTPMISSTDVANAEAFAKELINKVKLKRKRRKHPFINYD